MTGLQKVSDCAQSNDRLAALLIIDDADLSELYQLKLSLDGYEVEAVGRRGDWIELAEARDLVFIDLGEGSPGAIDLWRQFRRTPSLQHLPTVLLSSERHKALHDRGLRFGPLDHVIASVRRTSAGQLTELKALSVMPI